MYDLIAFTESQDSAVLVNVAGLADEHVRVVADDIIIPNGRENIAAVLAIGLNITLARLAAPSLRQIVNPELSALNVGAEPVVPTPLNEFWENPIPIPAGEALNFLAAEDGAGAQVSRGLVSLTDGPVAPVSGNIRTIRATNGDTLNADLWTNGALTFGSTLPVGEYDIVGMRYEGATALAARLLFQNENPTRPGCIGYDAVGDVENPIFRYGRLGVWGRFHTNAPPTVDFFADAADSAQVVFLDVMPA